MALSSKAAAPILGRIIARIDAGERPSAADTKDEIAASKKEPAEVTPVARQHSSRRKQPEQELHEQDRHREEAAPTLRDRAMPERDARKEPQRADCQVQGRPRDAIRDKMEVKGAHVLQLRPIIGAAQMPAEHVATPCT